MQNILILCTGNSCRSIIAEAILNSKLGDIATTYSSGTKPSHRVNPNAKRVLEAHGIWRDEYHSKTLDEVMVREYALVITVCDHAQETCPIFPSSVETIHVGFTDPDGEKYEVFENTYIDIAEQLIPVVLNYMRNHSTTFSNPNFL